MFLARRGGNDISLTCQKQKYPDDAGGEEREEREYIYMGWYMTSLHVTAPNILSAAKLLGLKTETPTQKLNKQNIKRQKQKQKKKN